MITKYGENSNEYHVALSMYYSVLSYAIEELKVIYEGKIEYQIVYLSEPSSSKQFEDRLFSLLEPYVKKASHLLSPYSNFQN